MSDFIDGFESFANDFDDLPEEKFPLRPEVLALVEVVKAEAKSNSRLTPAVPQIQLNLAIQESASDGEGKQAKGQLMDWLSKPEAGHPAMSEKAVNFQRGQFRKALVAMLAPEAKGKDAQNALVAQAARDAGGYDKALVGKRVIVKIGVNDGIDRKTGTIVNTARHEDPRNRIDNYIPATTGNIEKYIRVTS